MRALARADWRREHPRRQRRHVDFRRRSVSLSARRARRSRRARSSWHVPAYVTSTLFRERDGWIADACAAIPYASAATVALAFRRDAVAHPLTGSGFVVPRVEQTGILAGSWLSSKWPHRAPDGPRAAANLRRRRARSRRARSIGRRDGRVVAGGAAARCSASAARRSLRASTDSSARSAQHEVGHLARVAAIDRALRAASRPVHHRQRLPRRRHSRLRRRCPRTAAQVDSWLKP